MKQYLLVVVVFTSLFAAVSWPQAPGLQVAKAVGSSLTVSWVFPTASEAEIDGFVIEHCTGVNTGCTDLTTTLILKTVRSYVHTVTSTTSAKPFFQVRSVKGTERSQPGNPVAVTIIIPPPVSSYGQ